MSALRTTSYSLLLCVFLGISPAARAYSLQTCTNYHCDATMTVLLNSAEWLQVKQLFRDVDTAEQERERIARAIGLLERFVGLKNGTAIDRGRNPPDISPVGQLDCIAESTNSTAYLQRLQAEGLLKWHRVEERVSRHRWLVATHWTAVITDRDGVQYAVDSWYRDNGEPAIVLPLEAWYKGEER